MNRRILLPEVPMLACLSIVFTLWFAVASIATAQSPSADAPFFTDPSVYQMKMGDQAPGAAFGPEYAGRRISIEDASRIALRKFLEMAAASSIPEAEITKAIFEGRLNPDFRDLSLAAYGLSPSRAASVWNERFGSVIGIGDIVSIVKGREVHRTGKDFILQLLMNSPLFERYFHLKPDPALTYERVSAHLRTTQADLVEFLDQELQRLNKDMCAYTYFTTTGGDGRPRFRSDYDALRATKYIPGSRTILSSTGSSAPTNPLAPAKPGSAKPALQAKSAPASKRAAGGNALNRPNCDDLAAHPEDNAKVGAGVIDEEIKSTLAIGRCALAVEQSPKEGRLYFQLGRAYWAAEQYDEALDAFLEAEQLEYAPTYFYIGMAYEDGLIEGEQPDLAVARDMYMIAASEGFAPAIRAYQDFEEVWDVNLASLENPNFAQIIYENRFSEVPERASKVKPIKVLGQEVKINEKEFREQLIYYMVGVDSFLKQNPNQFDAACPAILDTEASAAINRWGRSSIGLPATSSGNAMQDNMELLRNITKQANNPMAAFRRTALNEAAQIAIQSGTDDIYALVVDYGGCQAAPVKQFYANMNRYVMEYAPKVKQ